MICNRRSAEIGLFLVSIFEGGNVTCHKQHQQQKSELSMRRRSLAKKRIKIKIFYRAVYDYVKLVFTIVFLHQTNATLN